MRRFEVWSVRLDPAIGSEIRKTRPAVIVSPNEANEALRTVVVVPLTSAQKGWPTRVAVTFAQSPGEAALDQIRAVDKARLVKRLGEVTDGEAMMLCARLLEMFSR